MTLRKLLILQQAVSGAEVIVENGKVSVRPLGNRLIVPGH